MSTPIQNVQDLAHLLKVIADETRLRILGAIAAEPRTGKELADLLELTPPTISHHMRKLTDAGIVLAKRDKQRQWYTLNADFLLEARRMPLREDDAPEDVANAGDRDLLIVAVHPLSFPVTASIPSVVVSVNNYVTATGSRALGTQPSCPYQRSLSTVRSRRHNRRDHQ